MTADASGLDDEPTDAMAAEAERVRQEEARAELEEKTKLKAKKRGTIRWTLISVTLVWVILAGLDQFLELGTIEFNVGMQQQNEVLQQRLRNCRGTFKERYECKSQILVGSGQQSFYFWITKFGVTFGPALLIYITYNVWMGALDRKDERARRVVRIARLEKEAEEAKRRAKEEGRQKSVTAKRRQAVRDAQKNADREESIRPSNVLLITEDQDFIKQVADGLLEHGYFVVGSNFKDAYLGYKEIGYHVVVADASYKGASLKDMFRDLRERKENIRAVGISPAFEGIPSGSIVENAVALGAEVVMPKPFDPQYAAAMFDMLLDTSGQDEEAEA